MFPTDHALLNLLYEITKIYRFMFATTQTKKRRLRSVLHFSRGWAHLIEVSSAMENRGEPAP